MKLSILGIGPVCALGSGMESFKSGLRGERQPRIEFETVEPASGAKQLPVYKPIVERMAEFIQPRALRRLDDFSRIALLSAYLAVEDAGVEFPDLSRVGIIFGSGHGPVRTTFRFLDSYIEDGDKVASPMHFVNSVHNAVSSQTSIFMGIKGPCQTISCFGHTAAAVFSAASDWLETGLVDYVLAGLGEEYCDLMGYSLASMKAHPATEMHPEDFSRCSFLPGEGHVAFLLGREDVPGRCKINRAQLRCAPEDAILEESAVFTADGNPESGKVFAKLAGKVKDYDIFTQYWGGMPTGIGFDLAAASLKCGEASGAISCCEYCGNGEINVYSLTR